MRQSEEPCDTLSEDLEVLLPERRALQALASLVGDGLEDKTAQAAQASYQRLQAAAEQSLADAQALQAQVQRLQAQLERIALQQEIAAACRDGGLTDPVQVLDRYRDERERARLEAGVRADSREAASRQAEALQQKLGQLSARLADAEEERRAELAPELKAAREGIDLLRNQLAAEEARAAAAQREVVELAARLETLQLETASLRQLSAECHEELAQRQPAQARHAADAAAAALHGLREEESDLVGQLREQEGALVSAEAQAQAVVAAQVAAVKAGDRLRAQMSGKERLLDEVQRDIETARLETEKLLADQVTLDLEVGKHRSEAKRASETCKTEQRGRDTALRRLHRAQREGEQLQGQLPPLENASHNLRSQLGALQKAAGREGEASGRLQEELLAMVQSVAKEKKLTELQQALVAASLEAVQRLEEERMAIRAMAVKREQLVQEAGLQRDAAARFSSQRTAKLREAITEAELREVEIAELQRRRGEAKAARAELRGLSELMSGHAGRLQTVLAAARKCAVDLGDQVAATTGELEQLESKASSRSKELRRAQRERVSAEAARVLAGNQLAMERRSGLAAAEAADDTGIEHGRLQRAAEEGGAVVEGLRRSKLAAQRAKQEAQRALLERDDELCGLYERSDALDKLLGEGAQALQRCDDEMRVLSLEAAELQRRLFATHKTAPDVPRYDRGIAKLKADLLQARREVDELGATLESPQATAGRWRLLPGKMPSVAELAGRLTQLEERLEQRRSQAAQKDQILEELACLADALVAQARASHGGAFDISVRLNESQQALQKLTRRMMAAVSELSLYSALSMKYGAEREALRSELEAAQRNEVEGKPPTPEADREFERMQRDAAATAEVRAQAAELRRLRDAGLLGQAASCASPRPQAYISEEQGVPVPFPAAFQPFKPNAAPAAVANAAGASASRLKTAGSSSNRGSRAGSPRPSGRGAGLVVMGGPS